MMTSEYIKLSSRLSHHGLKALAASLCDMICLLRSPASAAIVVVVVVVVVVVY
jgi:hypothetical protein